MDVPEIPQFEEDALLRLRAHMSSLARKCAAFEAEHASALACNDKALLEIDKGVQGELRTAVRSEATKIIGGAGRTYAAAVEFQRAARTLAGDAMGIVRLLAERASADSMRMRQEVQRSEALRERERYRANVEREAERAMLKAEIERLSAGWVGAIKHGSASVSVASAAMGAEIEATETALRAQARWVQTALETARDDHQRDMTSLKAAHAAKLGAALVAQMKATEERAASASALAAERRDAATAASSLREQLKQAEDARAALAEQLANERRSAMLAGVQAERERRTQLAQLSADKERESGTLSAEVQRLRDAIDEALQPCNMPGCDGRQQLFFESLKKLLGVRPSDAPRLAAAVPSASWRGQCERLEQPRWRSGKSDDELRLLQAARKPASARPTDRAISLRVRRMAAQRPHPSSTEAALRG